MKIGARALVGYTAIIRGDNYGERIFDECNSPILFETLEKCQEAFTVGEDDCIAIAKVTWEEPA